MKTVTLDVWEKVDVQYQVEIPEQDLKSMDDEEILQYICDNQPPRKTWSESVEERGASYTNENNEIVEVE